MDALADLIISLAPSVFTVIILLLGKWSDRRDGLLEHRLNMQATKEPPVALTLLEMVGNLASFHSALRAADHTEHRGLVESFAETNKKAHQARIYLPPSFWNFQALCGSGYPLCEETPGPCPAHGG
jgi:hypothetical protein